MPVRPSLSELLSCHIEFKYTALQKRIVRRRSGFTRRKVWLRGQSRVVKNCGDVCETSPPTDIRHMRSQRIEKSRRASLCARRSFFALPNILANHPGRSLSIHRCTPVPIPNLPKVQLVGSLVPEASLDHPIMIEFQPSRAASLFSRPTCSVSA